MGIEPVNGLVVVNIHEWTLAERYIADVLDLTY